MIGKRALVVGLLLCLGVGAMTYPFAAQWIAQFNQNRANERLADGLKQAGPLVQEQLRESAQAYNADLAVGRVQDGDTRYDREMLVEGTDVIARLRVPAIELDQPVRHTLEEDALLAGVGHAEGSSLPVGGPSTNAVLGGHRGLAQSVGFTRLPDLEIGDAVYIEALGETLTYRIIDTEVLEPLEAAIHPIEQGRDLVTLLTCTPLGVNSHRFVATAERVIPGDDIEAGVLSDQPGFPWWAVFGAAGFAGAGLVTWAVQRRAGAAERSVRDVTAG